MSTLTSGSSASESSGSLTEDAVVEAVKQYQANLESGSAPAIEEFLQQFPEIAGQLRPALEGLALFHPGMAVGGNVDHTMALMTQPQPVDTELYGKPIGDFQIVGQLGRGGMGVVYEAIQMSLNRRVALKVLPYVSGLDKIRLQRFRNEAYAAAQLHHTNIVPVYAVGNERGIHYYAMQLIEGQTLSELIERMRNHSGSPVFSHEAGAESDRIEKSNSLQRRGNSSKRLNETFRETSSQLYRSSNSRRGYFESVVEMMLQAAQALEHAHRYGVVHRDIKPGNLLLDQTGKTWVTDFGLAQIQHADSNLTRSGDQVGTLRYMSPEQACGNRDTLDHRTDIYSLGATLYELLTLRPVIQGENYRQMLNQIADTEPIGLRDIDASIPRDLDTIVRKAIAKEPSHRYQSAQMLANDLQFWLEDKPILAKPPTVWARLAKWRKRNSLLFNVAGVLMALTTIGLAITTAVVVSQQKQTEQALASEVEQRKIADENFRQARTAVDTFSDLSESELAFRPESQSIRTKFLQTSLEFYRSFLAQSQNNELLAQELTNVSAKVERILAQLELMKRSGLFLLLTDSRVLEDMQLTEEHRQDLRAILNEYRQTESDPLDWSDVQSGINDAGAERLQEFVERISAELSSDQVGRLQQIRWQIDLPMSMLADEVAIRLDLSGQQKQEIGRILLERRPGPIPRGDRGPTNRPGGFGLPNPEAYGPGRPPANGGSVGGPGMHGRRPPPDGPRDGPESQWNYPAFGRGGRPGSGGPGFAGKELGRGNDPPSIKRETVEMVLREVLDEKQRKQWHELIGPPLRQ